MQVVPHPSLIIPTLSLNATNQWPKSKFQDMIKGIHTQSSHQIGGNNMLPPIVKQLQVSSKKDINA